MQKIGQNSFLLKNFLLNKEEEVLSAIRNILRQSYWNDIYTKRGYKMSIQITNSGDYGWFSNEKGYHYCTVHPVTKNPWPPIPDILKELAVSAAKESGFLNFNPNCCLLNRYAIGTKLSLHQDVDEKDFTHPIVSFSIGIPATFLWGGFERNDKTTKIPLEHGDVVVFGGEDRLRFHGVEPIQQNVHEKVGEVRINLTFRKAD